MGNHNYYLIFHLFCVLFVFHDLYIGIKSGQIDLSKKLGRTPGEPEEFKFVVGSILSIVIVVFAPLMVAASLILTEEDIK